MHLVDCSRGRNGHAKEIPEFELRPEICGERSAWAIVIDERSQIRLEISRFERPEPIEHVPDLEFTSEFSKEFRPWRARCGADNEGRLPFVRRPRPLKYPVAVD